MAKVVNPLMSMSASGQIGKSLVYFKWKGLDVVRSYAIPANPKTNSQMTQRGYFTSAVNLFHSVAFNELDRSALNFSATLDPKPQSGFNKFVQWVVDGLRLGKTFTPLYDCSITNISENSATVKIKCGSDKSAKLYWGTSKTFLPNVKTGTFSSNEWTFSLSDLPSNSYIYFMIKNTATNDVGRTGVYYFKTL